MTGVIRCTLVYTDDGVEVRDCSHGRTVTCEGCYYDGCPLHPLAPNRKINIVYRF